MAAKVAPEAPAAAFANFTKPVPTTPPLSAYDPAYLARKAEVGEKTFALKKPGRRLAYFTEGDPADPAVLCLHSLGQSKWEWLFPRSRCLASSSLPSIAKAMAPRPRIRRKAR